MKTTNASATLTLTDAMRGYLQQQVADNAARPDHSGGLMFRTPLGRRINYSDWRTYEWAPAITCAWLRCVASEHERKDYLQAIDDPESRRETCSE